MAEVLRKKYHSRSVASEALLGGGRKRLQQGHGGSMFGWRQEKIAAGAWKKLALSCARASMLLGSKLRGGRLVQQ